MKVLPNQIIAHRTPAEAWRWACQIVNNYGDKVITEDRKLTKEVLNLQVQILEPGEGWPIPGSNWDLPGLEKYAEQLMSGENPSKFEYTYGERLRTYPDTEGYYAVDQIDFCIDRLRKNPTTRRSIAITWVPDWDDRGKEVPCLQLIDFLYRDGKMHLSAVFRSQDILQAFPANAYGLWRLMEYVAGEVGMDTGSLTIMAISGHIYEV